MSTMTYDGNNKVDINHASLKVQLSIALQTNNLGLVSPDLLALPTVQLWALLLLIQLFPRQNLFIQSLGSFQHTVIECRPSVLQGPNYDLRKMAISSSLNTLKTAVFQTHNEEKLSGAI